jgi:hypothetical protein
LKGICEIHDRQKARMKNHLLASLAMLALTAYAPAKAAQIPASAKTIAIVPLLPVKGHFFSIAALRFNNVCRPFDLKGANLESSASNAASSVLSSRYKVVRMTTIPGAEIRTKNNQVMGLFRSFPSIGEQIRQIARPASSGDAYVLIWSQQRDSDCLDVPRAYGYGVTKGWQPWGNAVLHAYGQVILVDGRSGEDLTTLPFKIERDLPGFDWKPDKPAEVTDQQMRMIKSALQKDIGSVAAETVQRLVPSQ